MSEQTYPTEKTEYALEVQDALGNWCRLRDTKPTINLMRWHLKVIWGDKIPWDGIRIIELKTTESIVERDPETGDFLRTRWPK